MLTDIAIGRPVQPSVLWTWCVVRSNAVARHGPGEPDRRSGCGGSWVAVREQTLQSEPGQGVYQVTFSGPVAWRSSLRSCERVFFGRGRLRSPAVSDRGFISRLMRE